VESRSSRRAPAWALAAIVSMAAFGLNALPAHGAPDPEQVAAGVEATSEVRGTVSDRIASAQGSTRTAERAVAQLTERRDGAQATVDDLTAKVTANQNRVTEMDRQLQSKDEEVTEMRRRLQKAATELWMAHAGTAVDESPSDQYLATVRRDTYGRSAGEIPKELIANFQKQRKELEVLRDRADEQRAAIELQRRVAERTVVDMDALIAVADRSRALEQAKLTRWTAIASAPETPMMSASQLTGPEIAAWFRSTGRTARLGTDENGGPMDIEKLATYFVEEGQRYGVRGDVAFAQAVHETGYFGFPEYGQVRPGDNNFAGIGACNSCDRGYQYPNARIGVRAQMQLLRNYSDPSITEATLPGGDKALFPNYDRFFLRGIARVWTDLNGRWAVPGTTYGQAIHRTYLLMYQSAVDNMTVLPATPAKPTAPTTTTSTMPTTGASVLSRPATPVGQ
jgi:hypothetical protein